MYTTSIRLFVIKKTVCNLTYASITRSTHSPRQGGGQARKGLPSHNPCAVGEYAARCQSHARRRAVARCAHAASHAAAPGRTRAPSSLLRVPRALAPKRRGLQQKRPRPDTTCPARCCACAAACVAASAAAAAHRRRPQRCHPTRLQHAAAARRRHCLCWCTTAPRRCSSESLEADCSAAGSEKLSVAVQAMGLDAAPPCGVTTCGQK